MVRWLMLGLLAIGVAVVLLAKTPGLLAIGFLLGFAGLFGFVFALAAERVAASARPESMMASPEELTALRRRSSAATPGAGDRERPPPKA